jgi:hypothetical protein
MSNAPRKLVQALLAASLIAGCGRVTLLPAQPASTVAAANRPGVTAAPRQQYVADDSVCRWSAHGFWGGGGMGDEYIAPVEAVSDAIVSELTGTGPAFSHDGELVATVDEGQVRVWRAEDGEPVYELAGDAFAFSPEGQTIAVQQPGEWYLWDSASAEELYRLADPGESLYFSADGRTIVTQEGWYAGTLRVYDAATGDKLLELKDVMSPTAISPDGTLLATTRLQDTGAININTIVLWDTATGTEQQVLQAEIQSQLPLAGIRGHRDVSSLAFSPDGQALLSAGPDAVRLWDAASGEHLRCFQTPDHLGATRALWGAEAETIIGAAANASIGPVVEKALYVWDAATNHPVGILGLDGGPALWPLGLSVDAEGGSLLAWSGYNNDGTGDRKAYLWDPSSRQLLGVLPTAGNLSEAALSPAGDRAVTVSLYDSASSDNPEEWSVGSETLLWDMQHAGVALAAAAQKSYRNALTAAVEGKPVAAQQRYLRLARSLSPELFAEVEPPDAGDTAAYAAYLARVELLKALGDDTEPAAKDFYAELQNASPKWLEWSSEELVEQVQGYILFGWGTDDAAGLAAAYQQLSTLAPDAARAPEVIGALLEMIAPDAVMLAQEGDIEGATALIQEVLAAYPDLDVQPEASARRLYAQVLVDEARSTAAVGEIAGAMTRFEEALALDPSLAIDPEAEANREFARTLVNDGSSAAWQGDAGGALARFEEALAFDPALIASPPEYVQISCALGPEVVGGANAAGVCADIGVNVDRIAPGDNVAGTVEAGAVDFWSFDSATPMTVALDMLADNSELHPRLYLIGPDGTIISEQSDYLGSGGLHVEGTLPEAGRYLAGAAGYLDASGDYRLTLSETGSVGD